jgi:glyoxylase-like metal-dependent hydrolase (beta-lactamase superfamily II)
MSLRQYAPGVFSWSRFQPERGYDFNGTALVSDAGVLLVDPISATDEELSALAKLGAKFEIVLLNADHERDAARFQQQFQAPVYVARPDAERVTVSGVVAFDDGHVFSGGWVAHLLPNMKTPGETVLHHSGQRIVVTGDALIGDPITGLRFVPPAKLPNPGAALESLRSLSRLDFDGLILGDGFSLPSGGREALLRFIAART